MGNFTGAAVHMERIFNVTGVGVGVGVGVVLLFFICR
jgi:hypothetical protein